MKTITVCFMILIGTACYYANIFFQQNQTEWQAKLAASEKKAASYNDLEQKNEDLTAQLADLQAKMDAAAKDSAQKLQTAQAQIDALNHAMPSPERILSESKPIPDNIPPQWVGLDGTLYDNVKVLRVQEDAVTVSDDEGGGLVKISNLPPNLQKLFDYNPEYAAQVADARAAVEAKNQEALDAEHAADIAAREQSATAALSAEGTHAVQSAAESAQSQLAGLDEQISVLEADVAHPTSQDAWREQENELLILRTKREQLAALASTPSVSTAH
jgi:uncharacterized protein HemX